MMRSTSLSARAPVPAPVPAPILALVLALVLALAACASGPDRGPRGQGPGGAGVNQGLSQGQTLLARARHIQGEEGCARAAPAYRVVASFGADYEVAQYELGACLLEMTGVNDDETALLREEGLFWTRRAAWAGHARAQHRLAHLLSGANYDRVSDVAPDPVAAMGWALVYDDNAARSLYALPDVAEPVLEHLRASLSDEEAADADAFAASFETMAMAAFAPPAPSRAAGSGRIRAPNGQRPGRRRLAEDSAGTASPTDGAIKTP